MHTTVDISHDGAVYEMPPYLVAHILSRSASTNASVELALDMLQSTKFTVQMPLKSMNKTVVCSMTANPEKVYDVPLWRS